jgi:hypothetical protein
VSDGDLGGVRAMYPGCAWPVPIAKKLRDDPVPVKKLRDDIGGVKKLRDDPVPVKKVRDDAGGVKKVRDDVAPRKKVIDDPRFKKIVDDNVIVKPVRDPGPVKASLDPMPGPLQPGGPVAVPRPVAPFSIATPHHALEVGAAQAAGLDPASASYLTALQQQMLDLEAAIAQANATAAQAAAEAARLQEASNVVAAALQDAMDQLGGS